MAMMNASEGFGQSLSFGPNAAQAAAASNRMLDARETRLEEERATQGIRKAVSRSNFVTSASGTRTGRRLSWTD